MSVDPKFLLWVQNIVQSFLKMKVVSEFARVQVFPIGFVECLCSGFGRLYDLTPAHGRMNLKYEKGNWWMPWH